MDQLIKPEIIADNSVYGVRQMQYTVDGVSGKDFIDALATAALRQSVSIESAASGYVAVVKARQKKVDDLGQVLAYLSKAVGSLKTKGGKSGDKVTVDNANWVKSMANAYGISLSWDGNKMTRGDIQKAQTTVEYELDKEDNNLQQDIVSLQSFMTKRDNAYSTVAKIVRKADNAAASTIRNIQ